MGANTRQFKALMKKNFINWKRQPGCAVCEICCPAFIMLILVWVRTLISPTSAQIDLQQFQTEVYPVFPRNADGWVTEDFVQIGEHLQKEDAFQTYDDYTPLLPTGYSLPNEFDSPLERTIQVTAGDLKSPFYVFPSECAKENSPFLPKKELNLIALVGVTSTSEMSLMTSYLEGLIANQKKASKQLSQVFDLTYPNFKFRNFSTMEDLQNYISAPNYGDADVENVCYGFELVKKEVGDYALTIVMNDQALMGGKKSVGVPSQLQPAYNPSATSPSLGDYQIYLQRGYSMLQNLAANVVLQLEQGNTDAQIGMMYAPMQVSQVSSDSFESILQQLLPFFVLLMFIPPVYNMTFLVVREKESRAKEAMRMMGMSDLPYWLSWFVYYTCISTALSTLAWAILITNVVQHSNLFLVWLFIWLYGLAVFGQVVFLQSLFASSKYSGIVGTLIYFGCNLLGIPVQSATASAGMKIGFSIFPQVALAQICAVFGTFEGSGLGQNFGNVFDTLNNYSFGTGLIMLLVSLIFFTCLGLYLDKILPKTYGEKKSCCFCLSCKRVDVDEEEDGDEQERERRSTLATTRKSVTDPFELKYLEKENYEPVPPEIARLELQNKFLKIADLTKTYPNGFQAVNGVNLKMYNGQIFALLGHNGAGKSTTISMLTGLLPKTTGSASIFEDNLFGNMGTVRQYLGVCPQHDVLFEFLTPEEHLDIFYDFKGGNPETKQTEINSLIVDVGVEPDKNKQAGSLSGGNKRKLSVAIALCGGSKLVMLDEPTAGMDLSARRSLWDMLKNYRRDRIIILTTHYMDEADVLGDRIGIMSAGKIRCLGSSLFLKNRYGAGYKLTIVKKQKQNNTLVEPYLTNVFGAVEKLSEVSSEITFKIGADKTHLFGDFFTQFDQDLDQLQISSYGISMTTLEEVFLKVSEEERDHQIQNEGPDMNANPENNEASRGSINHASQGIAPEESPKFEADKIEFEEAEQENLVGKGSVFGNISALLAKRFHIYKRDRGGLCCEVFVPIILVIFGLGLTKIDFLKTSPTTLLEPSAYPLKQRLLMNNEPILTDGTFYTGTDFYNNLPSVSSSFSVTYDETATNYQDFYNQVFEQSTIGAEKPYRFGSYQIYEANSDTDQYRINSFMNLTSPDVTAYFPQFMYESVLKTATGNQNFKFQTTTQPFPVYEVYKQRATSSLAFDFTFIVAIALALIPCVIISFIIKEREKQLKHMQVISGVNLIGYWGSNMISDLIKAYIPIFFIILFSALFDLQYKGVWAIFLMFPLAIVPFTYVTSFVFVNDTIAQIMTLFLHFLGGGIMPLVVYTLQIIPSTIDTGDKLRWWMCLLPTYCVGESIIWSSSSVLLIEAREAQPNLPQVNTELWSLHNLGGNMLILAGHFVVGTLLLALIESDLFSCKNLTIKSLPEPREDLQRDEDVEQEEQRLNDQLDPTSTRNTQKKAKVANDEERLLEANQDDNAMSSDVIQVSNFRKVYTTLIGDPFLAVEKISFGLDYGECFALLGVNGAGKSTTFKSLTKDIIPTSGTIKVGGHNIGSDFNEARKMIGYCPQHDAIFDLMTVEEHLWLYAKIKGVPENRRFEQVEHCIKQLSLMEHRNKPAGTLSGGNKRKLSVGIAIIGNPPIILLDEPSAGMDPEARRFMWSVVEKISQRDKKSAVILTTHSMEEAEALSTKMGIMVRGGIFRCYGSSQHIKNKFGTGYEIEIKTIKNTFETLEPLSEKLGFGKDLDVKVNLQEAIQKCERAEFDGLILSQICLAGLGQDLVKEAELDTDGQVRLLNFVQFLKTQSCGFQFIEYLAKLFPQVELVEQCGDFFKFRVPKEDKTIGYLFGLIEAEKDNFQIQEYSVSQTSLEQIFQTFANLTIDDKAAFAFKMNALDQLQLLNPDRKSTIAQKRQSMQGLK